MPSTQREPTMAYTTPKKNTQKKPNLFQLGHIVHAHFEQNRNFSPKLGKTKIVA